MTSPDRRSCTRSAVGRHWRVPSSLGLAWGNTGRQGKRHAIPGHNIPLAALGVFILWLGWFGFNPGSTTAVAGGDFARIAVNTNLSAAAGALGAMFASWYVYNKTDPLDHTQRGAGRARGDHGRPAMSSLRVLSVLTGLIAGPDRRVCHRRNRQASRR